MQETVSNSYFDHEPKKDDHYTNTENTKIHSLNRLWRKVAAAPNADLAQVDEENDGFDA